MIGLAQRQRTVLRVMQPWQLRNPAVRSGENTGADGEWKTWLLRLR